MIATNVPAEMVTTDTIMPVLTVSVVMLFTPTFLGNWIFAVLLVLIMRRHAWPRWVLLAGGVISLFFFARSLMSGVTDDILLRVGMYVLYFAALTMMFLRESSAWFRP